MLYILTRDAQLKNRIVETENLPVHREGWHKDGNYQLDGRLYTHYKVYQRRRYANDALAKWNNDSENIRRFREFQQSHIRPTQDDLNRANCKFAIKRIHVELERVLYSEVYQFDNLTRSKLEEMRDELLHIVLSMQTRP